MTQIREKNCHILTQQVHKNFLKYCLGLAGKGKNRLFRWSRDLTAGALCPPTLTLPLSFDPEALDGEGGGKGGGDAGRHFYATFR